MLLMGCGYDKNLSHHRTSQNRKRWRIRLDMKATKDFLIFLARIVELANQSDRVLWSIHRNEVPQGQELHESFESPCHIRKQIFQTGEWLIQLSRLEYIDSSNGGHFVADSGTSKNVGDPSRLPSISDLETDILKSQQPLPLWRSKRITESGSRNLISIGM